MDNWLRELESTNDLVPEISRLIGQRKKVNDEKLMGDIAKMLEKFDTKIEMLQEDLNEMAKNPITFRITEQEAERRQEMLNLLHNRNSQYKQFMKQIQSGDRDQLLGTPSSRPSRTWGETTETQNLDSQQVLQLQKDKMKMQDEKLAVLGQSITRQKHIAQAIGDETEIHLQILDEVDSRIGNTTASVMKGSRQIDNLREKSSTCSCWLVIAILFLIIVVLVLV